VTDTDPTKPVTPGEIDAAQFTQVRNLFSGRRGYDEDEVDEFLDRTATTIANLMRENDALHTVLDRERANAGGPS
jgi:DivIVA domain-containing protein